jgi:DNA processing protein
VTDETGYWIAFSVFPGIGPVRFKLLHDYFGSAKAAWESSESSLEETGLGKNIVSSLSRFRHEFDVVAYQNKLRDLHVHAFTLLDPRYPKLLRDISDAPFVLYVKGKRSEPPLDLARTIGVVGTRKITPYGTEVTRRLVSQLVSHGFTIVSGLAYGVDTVAHQTALDMGGKTIAVLGCGIDIVAPPGNARLYEDIARGGGAIVSEMPLGHRPSKGLFPARNRIISGLSLGVVVTEGAHDSGALITARNAAEQGREVFAVPGPITSPNSKGPAKLLKNGAKLVESVDDILEELGIISGNKFSQKNVPVVDTKEEQKIIDVLAAGSRHIDELVRATGLTMKVVSATITLLEMKHQVRDLGEKTYSL